MNYVIQVSINTYEQVLLCECMSVGAMYDHIGKS